MFLIVPRFIKQWERNRLASNLSVSLSKAADETHKTKGNHFNGLPECCGHSISQTGIAASSQAAAEISLGEGDICLLQWNFSTLCWLFLWQKIDQPCVRLPGPRQGIRFGSGGHCFAPPPLCPSRCHVPPSLSARNCHNPANTKMYTHLLCGAPLGMKGQHWASMVGKTLPPWMCLWCLRHQRWQFAHTANAEPNRIGS